MKVTVLLRRDHETLRGLMDEIGTKERRKLNGKTVFQKIKNEHQIHSQMASEVFYSALAATPSDRAVELVASAQQSCQAVERLFQELSRMNPSDKNFDTKMNAVITEIGRHIEMEEDELFHEARKAFPEHRLEELGLEMQDRRNTLKMLAVV